MSSIVAVLIHRQAGQGARNGSRSVLLTATTAAAERILASKELREDIHWITLHRHQGSR